MLAWREVRAKVRQLSAGRARSAHNLDVTLTQIANCEVLAQRSPGVRFAGTTKNSPTVTCESQHGISTSAHSTERAERARGAHFAAEAGVSGRNQVQSGTRDVAHADCDEDVAGSARRDLDIDGQLLARRFRNAEEVTREPTHTGPLVLNQLRPLICSAARSEQCLWVPLALALPAPWIHGIPFPPRSNLHL